MNKLNNDPDYDYSESLLERMKSCLLNYHTESNITWNNYCHVISESTGISQDERVLNLTDPRDWIMEGHRPGTKKLNAYARFIKKIYPDFDFSAA